MVWEKLKEELIIPGLEAKSSDDIFEALGGKLVKQGYCKESYVQALKDREAEFPTGINTGENETRLYRDQPGSHCKQQCGR